MHENAGVAVTGSKPRTPAGLGAGGRRLWSAVVGPFDLRPDELRILDDACREVDLVDRLEEAVAAAPLVVEGSRGQEAPHPLIPELRAHRLVLARLLKQLGLPDEPGIAKTKTMARSTSARKAAAARWRRDGQVS